MAFSDDAIGFLLAIEDQLSPTLATAEQNYYRFVRSLDKYNRQAFRSANQGMEALAEVVESFTALPKQAERAYDDALHRMQAKSKGKTITQQVDFVFSAKGQKELGRTIGEAVAKVLAKSKLRLSADVPTARSKFFDTSIALRRAYKGQIQPPDMAGMFENLPHFQEGGIVGGQGDIDKVLAMLTPGEMVLPKKVSESLRQMAELGKGQRLAQGLTAAVVDIENLAKGLERVQDLTETGLDPNAVNVYAAGVAALNKRYQDLLNVVSTIGAKRLPKFIGVLKDAKGQVDKFAKALDKAEDKGKDLQKVIEPAKFLATHTALRTLTDTVKGLGHVVGVDGQALESFNDAMNTANVTLNLTRAELAGVKTDLLEVAKRAVVDPTRMAAGFGALVDAGMRGREMLLQFSAVVGRVAEANTKADPAAIADSVRQLAENYQFSGDQALAYMGTLKEVAATGKASFEDLLAQSKEVTQSGFLAALGSPEARKTALEGLARMTQALQSEFAESGADMATLFARAATDTEAWKELQTLGIRPESIREALQSGDATLALRELSQGLRGFTGDANEMGLLTQALQGIGFKGTAEQAINMANRMEPIIGRMGEMEKRVVATSDALAASDQHIDNARTGFQGLVAQVKTFALALLPEAVFEFFDAFDPQALASTMFLLQQSGVPIKGFISGVASMTKTVLLFVPRLIGMAFGLGAYATAQAAASTAAATSTGPMAALSAGIVALAPAVPIILALAVAILAIGAAVWLAKDPLIALIGVFGKVVDGVVQIAMAMTKMAPTAMLALAGSLLVLGPAFFAMGSGIFLMSQSLLASVPGLLAFSLVLKVMGALTGTVSSVAGVIDGMVTAFAVDPGKMRVAVEAIGLSVAFVAGFAALTAGLTVLAGGAVVGKAVGALMGLFGLKSPFAMLKDQSVEMRDTVSGIANTFGGMSKDELDRFGIAAKNFEVMGRFMRDYSNTVAAVQGAAPNLLIEKVSMELRAAWEMQGPFGRLSSQAGQMLSTVRALAGTFGGPGLAPVMAQLEVAAPRMKKIADFVSDYALVAEVLDDIDNLLVQEGVLGMISNLGSGSPFENLKTQATGIIETLDEVIVAFAGQRAAAAFDPARMALASEHLGQLANFVPTLKPALEAIRDAGTLAGELKDPSAWKFWASDGPLTNLRKVAPDMVTTLKALTETFSTIGPTKDISGALQTVTQTLSGVEALTVAMKSLGTATTGLDAATLATTSTTARNVVGAATGVSRSLIDALASGMTAATEVPMASLMAKIEPATTRAMIEQAILVKLDPSTTDEPVRAELEKTNALLEQLLTAMQSGAGGIPSRPAQAPTRARKAGAPTLNVAGGYD